MNKSAKVMGIINSLLILCILVLLGLYFYEINTTDDLWSAMGLYIIALLFIFLSILLTIPLIVIVIKYGFNNMKYYAYSHLSLVLLSIAMLVISFITN